MSFEFIGEKELRKLFDSRIGKNTLDCLVDSLRQFEPKMLGLAIEHLIESSSFVNFPRESSYHLICFEILQLAALGERGVVVKSNREFAERAIGIGDSYRKILQSSS